MNEARAMKIFTGIDIVELERFRAARHFHRLAEFILSPQEQLLMDKSRDRHQYLASRFAAKEAVIKALPEPACLADMEIITKQSKPEVNFLKSGLKRYQTSVSISHSEHYAVGSAVVTLKL